METSHDYVESLSVHSLLSGSSVSIMDPPSRLEKEYDPLRDVYARHSQPLPLKDPGIKDSNSEALVNALKTLQLKIERLERDRVEADDHFKHVSEETVRNHDDFTSSDEENTHPSMSHPPDTNFDRRLTSLDTRFALQARELELLRERLRNAETEREEAMRKTIELERKQHQQQEMVSPQKVEELERQQVKLKASNILTKTKLRELEGQLLRQQWEKRKTSKSSSRPSEVVSVAQRKKSGKKQAPPTPCSGKPVPGVHYHLNMKDVPFVVGTSTGPSHSVPANYQKVVSLMKYHNKMLCGAAAESLKENDGEQQRGKKKKRSSNKRGMASGGKAPPTGASLEELQGLLSTLEEEFAGLAFHHQEIAKSIQEHSHDPDTSDQLQSELGDLILQLENKMEQIELIKRLVSSAKRGGVAKQGSRKGGRHNGQVATVYSKKRKEPGVSLYSKSSSSSGSGSKAELDCGRGSRAELDCGRGSRAELDCGRRSGDSLAVLKGIKKLQSTLQREDLSWTS